MTEPTPCQSFRELAALPDHAIDLAWGALLISAEENPGLDPEPSLERLDRWADELRPRVTAVEGDLEKLDRVRRFLFHEKGLKGNREEYYDPRNSFLDQVLERRLGIPISLAVVLLEVARRVGVPLVGVGFPGHFLVRHGLHPQIFLDPFDGGNLLTSRDCADILKQLTHGRIRFSSELLRPVGRRQILLRMLNNLCGIYLSRGELGRTLSVLDRSLLLYPGEPRFLRNRGILRLKAGDCPGAIADLETYLEAEPDAPDWDDVAGTLEKMRSQAARIH